MGIGQRSPLILWFSGPYSTQNLGLLSILFYISTEKDHADEAGVIIEPSIIFWSSSHPV